MAEHDGDAASDEALLERWRGGDKDAGATLLERHHESVARFFMTKLGPDADDLVQATFLGLLDGALDRYRVESSFRTFLFGIARKKLLEHLRNIIRDRERFDPEHDTLAAHERSFGSVLDARGQDKLLLAALRQLPVDTQMMLELHYWEGLRVREIAAILELPINTVKTRMRRGRQDLDERMRTLASSRAALETTLRGLEGWAAALRDELGEGEGEGEGEG